MRSDDETVWEIESRQWYVAGRSSAPFGVTTRQGVNMSEGGGGRAECRSEGTKAAEELSDA